MENPLKICMPRSLQDVISSVRRSTSFIKSQTPTNRKTEKGIHWFLKQRRLKIPIITTSRCSYTRGKDVAEAVVKTLGYTCLSREELLDASQEFNKPGIKLVQELPIILEQTIFNKYRYISYIRSALLRHLAKGNITHQGGEWDAPFANHYKGQIARGGLVWLF